MLCVGRGKSGHSPVALERLDSRVAAPTPERVRSSDIEKSSEVTPVTPTLRRREVRAETLYFEKNKASYFCRMSFNSNIGGETAKSLPECKAVLRRYVGGCRLTPTVTSELDK